MDRAGAACVLVGLLSACSKAQPTRPEEPSGQVPARARTFHDDGVDMRKRLSGYLGSKVTPEFRDCWAKLRGEGALAIDLEFRKVERTWVFDRALLKQSSLEKGQEAVAVGCLETVVRGTSFEADLTDSLEAAGPRMVARQGWPVPLPAEGERLPPDVVARRFGGSGGPGVTIQGCSTCVHQKGSNSYKCEARDTGSDRDCEEKPPNSCVTTPDPCVKDIIYGWKQGLVIF
jgi:hypothetical protein